MQMIRVIVLALWWGVFAQPADPTGTIAFGVVSPGPGQPPPALDELIEATTEQLSETDITFAPVTWDAPLPDVIQERLIGLMPVTTTGTATFTYLPESHVLEDISPVLLPPTFPVTALAAPHAADLLATGAFYSAGACPAARQQMAPYTDDASLQPFTLTLIGTCHLIEADYPAAIAALTPAAAVALEGGRADGVQAAVNLAWAYLQQGQPDDAFAVMNTLVSLYQEQASPVIIAQILAKRAELHALAFNFDRAIADATEAIQLDPDNPRYYKQRGDHIFLIYEWDRVLDDYNTALRLDPTYADAYFARGVLYYTQGPRPTAQTDFQTFLDLVPDDDPRITEAQGYIASIQAELDALGGDDTGAFGPSD
jgi:hypothetical protein